MRFIEISPWDFNCYPFSLVGRRKMLLSATDRRGTNVMTVAWGGFGVMWGQATVFFAVRPSRYTYSFAEGGDCFSLMALADGYQEALTYCGTHSGRDEDKIKGAGLTPIILPSGGFCVDEADLAFELKKLYSQTLSPVGFSASDTVQKWYGEGDIHKLYFATVEKIYRKE